MQEFKFKEIEYNKMRTFQFADEPELIHKKERETHSSRSVSGR